MLSLPPLYAILDTHVLHGAAVLDVARAFLDGGARLIQLRAKEAASGELLDLAERLVALAAPVDAAIVVNDRADVARLAGAAGVHVGQDDLPPADARAIVGAGRIVGVSTHDPEQVDRALREPVGYVAVGPVYGTATKQTGYAAVGLDLVRYAVTRADGRVPIVAIGGITLDRAPEVIAAGASSVAVISDLFADGDPEGRVRAYVERLA